MEVYKNEKRGAGSMERDERFRLMRFVLFLMTVVSLTTIPLLPTCAQTQYGEDNKYYLLFNVNNITNGARGLIDREQDSGRDIDLMVLMKTFSQAWSLIGDDNGFQLKKTHDRYIAWNNDSKRYIVTSDAQRAAMFKVIKQGNNSYLQRVGSESNKVVVPNGFIASPIWPTEQMQYPSVFLQSSCRKTKVGKNFPTVSRYRTPQNTT